eukprot:10799207-Alexandrium_andersonii.AAC.1
MEQAARAADRAERRLGRARTLRSDLASPASPSWTKGGAHREASGPSGRTEEARLLEHRLLERTHNSESGVVSLWQECVDRVALRVTVASFRTACVVVEHERH